MMVVTCKHTGLPFRAFLYPSDLQLELEYWAETGEYSEEELHEVWGTNPAANPMTIYKPTLWDSHSVKGTLWSVTHERDKWLQRSTVYKRTAQAQA